MEAVGIRRIDRLSRVVIPSEIRRIMNITNESMIEMFIEGDSLILKKYEPKAKLNDALNLFNDRFVVESIDLDYHDVKEIKKRISEIGDILRKKVN